MLTQIIVFALLFGLVAGGVWLFRSSRAERAETSEALAAMACTLETTFDAASRSMSGRLNGHAVSIHEELHRGSPEDNDRYIRITVEASAGAPSLQLLRKGSALTPSFANDVQTGDPVFDRGFMVLSDNADKVRQVLTPDVRRQLLDLQWLGELRVSEGQLRCMGGVGFLRKRHVDECLVVLHLLIRIADGLR